MATEVTKTSHLTEAVDGEGLKRERICQIWNFPCMSAFCRFEVRRMKPLEKLKEMAKSVNRWQRLETVYKLFHLLICRKNDR